MSLWQRLWGPKVAKLTPQELYAHLQTTEGAPLLVLDVRQPFETRAGLIPGAHAIPLTQLRQRLTELPHDRTIVCVCRSNHRSPIAARLLAQAGFSVLDMREGMLGWERAGLPLAMSVTATAPDRP